MEAKDDMLKPQELVECEKCTYTLGQCYMKTSRVPCMCEAYSKYLKGKEIEQ